MEVIPLTLGLSLLLSLTFIALFLREFTRPRRAGAEHDSLLPLEDDHSPAHSHAAGETCSGGDPSKPSCASCRRRKERQAQRDAARAASTPTSLA